MPLNLVDLRLQEKKSTECSFFGQVAIDVKIASTVEKRPLVAELKSGKTDGLDLK